MVSRVHGEEDPKLRVHVHIVTVREDEVLPFLLLARQHDGNLKQIN